MKSPTIQTSRLNLVPFMPEMFNELHELFTHPSVRKYLLDDMVVEPQWVHDAISTSQKTFGDDGYGLWAIRIKGINSIIGFSGFWRFEHLPYPLHLNYALLPSSWGKGFATEAAKAVMDYAFNQLGFAEIVAAADIPNKASFGVMSRLGMHFWMAESGVNYFRLER